MIADLCICTHYSNPMSALSPLSKVAINKYAQRKQALPCVSALLIGPGQEHGNSSESPGLKADKDSTPTYHAEQGGPRSKEGVGHQSLSADSRARFPTAANRQAAEEQGQLAVATPQHDEDRNQRTRSEQSSQGEPAHGRKGEGEGEHRREPTNIYGAGSTEASENNDNLTAKTYTKLWFCHRKCQNLGPWRSQITRCLGCEHDRCGLCEEEIVVTRDPSPPHG